MKLPKGYFKVPDFVFALGLTAYVLIVLIYLCRRSDKHGVSFPSLNRIGKDCGIKSRTTVINAIKQLQDLKLIEKVRSGSKGRSNRYKLSTSIIAATRNQSVKYESKNNSSSAEQPCSNTEHKLVHKMNTKDYTEKEIKKKKEHTCNKEIINQKTDSASSKRKAFHEAIELVKRRALGEQIDLSPILQKLRGGGEDV